MAIDKIIIQYEADVKKLQTQLKSVEKKLGVVEKKGKQSAKGIEKSFSGLGNTIKNIGITFGIAFGANELLRIFGNAVNVLKSFEKELSTLQSITGSTEQEMKFFAEAAKEVGKATLTSATEVVKAFTLVGSAQPELLKNRDALKEVTEQALILAKAAGIDVVSAAGALTKSMNQFGASAQDAAKFTDILATSQQKGSSFIIDTAEALKNSGAAAKAAGLSFEETNVAIQALAKGGIQGAEAGTKLRTILIRLAKQSDDTINPSIVGLQGAVDGLSKKNLTLVEATKLFGEESATAALTLIAQKSTVDSLSGALNEQGNALAQAETNMDNLDGALIRLGLAWENIILTQEDSTSVFKDFANVAADVLEDTDSLSKGFDFLTEGIRIVKEGVKLFLLPLTALGGLIVDVAKGANIFGDSLRFIADVGGMVFNALLRIPDAIAGLGGALEAVFSSIADLDFANLGDKAADGFSKAFKKNIDAKFLSTIESMDRATLLSAETQNKLQETFERQGMSTKEAIKARKELTSETLKGLTVERQAVKVADETIEKKKKVIKLSKEQRKAIKDEAKASTDLAKILIKNIDDEVIKRQEAAKLKAQLRINALEDTKHRAELEGEIFKELANDLAKIDEDITAKHKEEADQRTADTQAAHQEQINSVLDLASRFFQIDSRLVNDLRSLTEENVKELSKIGKGGIKELTELSTESLNALAGIAQQIMQMITDVISAASAARDAERALEAQRTDQAIADIERQAEAGVISQETADKRILELKLIAFNQDKIFALKQLQIDKASALIKLLSKGFFGLVQAIFVEKQFQAQKQLILEQQPNFAKGEVNIQGKGTGTSDSINANISRGESVITAKSTKIYKDELIAANNMNLDSLIQTKYVLPALEKQKRSLMDNMTSSIALQNMFDDGNIVSRLKKGTEKADKNADKIVTAIKSSQRELKLDKLRSWDLG